MAAVQVCAKSFAALACLPASRVETACHRIGMRWEWWLCVAKKHHPDLHPDDKEVGVALIDIGGGTTDIAVFEDGTIRHTAVIAVAGNKVTDDIRKG